MQYKKTEKSEITAELPDLDEREINFCNGILSGKTAAQAYRDAFPVAHWNPNSVWVESCRLKNSPKVRLWLSAARRAHLGSTNWPFERYIRELEEAMQDAKDASNHVARLKAVELIGNACGHHAQRLEIVHGDPADTLKEIAAISPEVALLLARQASACSPKDKTCASETQH